MNSNLKTTKEALAILRCANNTFNSHLEKQAIKPIRVGTRSFFTLEQIEILKNSIANAPTQTDSDAPVGDPGQHDKELIEAREEIQILLMQVSQWQQQAQTYQEKYQKLLSSQQEQGKDENAGEKRWWNTFFRKVT